jgi:hypothetical protein
MRLYIALSALFLSLALMASPARALPAPMSDQELMEKSDLVALVRVLNVTCTSLTKDAATGARRSRCSRSRRAMPSAATRQS